MKITFIPREGVPTEADGSFAFLHIEKIENCDRCGGTHEGWLLTATRFEFVHEPRFDGDGHILYTHWVSCPKTKDPILIYAPGPGSQ